MKVWDRWVRIGHWLLALFVLSSWFSRHSAHTLHETLGYGALVVVLARLYWGWRGSHYARFAQFVQSPRATLGYAREVIARREARFIGHNPLGACMVLALLLTTAAVCASGWLYTTDTFWGVEWVANVHERSTYLLLALVGLHLAGVLYACVRHNENLVAAMITGEKSAPNENDRT